MAKLIPQVDSWYQDVSEDVLFEVVAVDEQGGYVEIQYLTGEIGEFDFETWGQMVLLSAKAPEDWREPFEIPEEDNTGEDVVSLGSNWEDAQASIDRELAQSVDDY
jgi:hypothetical protein